MRVVVVGDVLLDRDVAGTVERVCPDAPALVVEADGGLDGERPGGAGMAAVLAARAGAEVTLVTALAADEAGRRLARLLDGAGIEVVAFEAPGPTPEKVRIRAAGQTLLRLDRGRPEAPGPLAGSPDLSALRDAATIVVADYGRGVTAHPAARTALAAVAPAAPIVWDPHPRGAPPLPGTWLATPNLVEARGAVGPEPGVARRGGGLGDHDGAGQELGLAGRLGHALRRRWDLDRVAVTVGPRGAVLVTGEDAVVVVPARAVPTADPCGAGDAFAVGAALAASRTADAEAVVTAAVDHARAYLLAGGPAGLAGRGPIAMPSPPGGEGWARVEAVQAGGGRVVATSGCFDLLHPGHVAMLRSARALGDALVVLLNSDASVRRLKGPSRPVQCQDDRAAVLAALSMVDAVVVFDERTPVDALERLRPDVFVKGGDYVGVELPEQAAMRRWGGSVVIVPFVEGYSTSRLVEEASRAS